jgi:hypothetical protein
MNDYGPEFHNRAEQRLAALGQSPEQLCADLYGGQMSLQTPGLLTHLRLLALERLSMHQPRYVGLKVAKQKWQIRDA